jgi:hypothetical protein
MADEDSVFKDKVNQDMQDMADGILSADGRPARLRRGRRDSAPAITCRRRLIIRAERSPVYYWPRFTRKTTMTILNNALSGALASQLALSASSQNIANLQTKGYTRQAALLSAVGPMLAARPATACGQLAAALLGQLQDPADVAQRVRPGRSIRRPSPT